MGAERHRRGSATTTAPTTTTPTNNATTPAVAAGGGNGQVWVNTKTHVYHTQGSRWYGKTKGGKYMTEQQAIQEGDRAGQERLMDEIFVYCFKLPNLLKSWSGF